VLHVILMIPDGTFKGFHVLQYVMMDIINQQPKENARHVFPLVKPVPPRRNVAHV
jgi:hypothetical protein